MCQLLHRYICAGLKIKHGGKSEKILCNRISKFIKMIYHATSANINSNKLIKVICDKNGINQMLC